MKKLHNQAKLDFYQAEIDAHLAELEVELEKMKNEDLALKIGRVIFLFKVRMGTLQEGLEELLEKQK